MGDKVSLIMSNNLCSDGTLPTNENLCTLDWISEVDFYNAPGTGDYMERGSSSKGPITVMNYLYETTKNWSNIENIKINYKKEGQKIIGYGGIITEGDTTRIIMLNGTVTASYDNLKARLIMKLEADGVGCTIDYGSCPPYIVNGIRSNETYYPIGTKEDLSKLFGYWSMTSINASTSNVAYNINFNGYFRTDFGYLQSSVNGIRPVIEVFKHQL